MRMSPGHTVDSGIGDECGPRSHRDRRFFQLHEGDAGQVGVDQVRIAAAIPAPDPCTMPDRLTSSGRGTVVSGNRLRRWGVPPEQERECAVRGRPDSVVGFVLQHTGSISMLASVAFQPFRPHLDAADPSGAVPLIRVSARPLRSATGADLCDRSRSPVWSGVRSAGLMLPVRNERSPCPESATHHASPTALGAAPRRRRDGRPRMERHRGACPPAAGSPAC